MSSHTLSGRASLVLRIVISAAVAASPVVAQAETQTGTEASDYLVGAMGASTITAGNGDDVVIGDPAGRKVTGITLLSTNEKGEKANAPSFFPVISADGRFLAFSSKATNLSPIPASGTVSNIFIKDLATGKVRCLTCGAGGDSFLPVYSRIPSRIGFNIAFQTFGQIDGNIDTNGFLDVYDCAEAYRTCGFTYLAQDGRRRVGGGGSSLLPAYPYFSRDPYFITTSSNLSDRDTDTFWDVYRNRPGGLFRVAEYVPIGPSIIKRNTFEFDFNVAGDTAVSTDSLFVVPARRATGGTCS